MTVPSIGDSAVSTELVVIVMVFTLVCLLCRTCCVGRVGDGGRWQGRDFGVEFVFWWFGVGLVLVITVVVG